MIYLAYAKTGKEFEVEAAIKELGISVWCGRKVEVIRVPKRREHVKSESPTIPNYLFIDIPAERFLELRNVKHLSHTMHSLSNFAVRDLERFKSAVAEDKKKALVSIERMGASLVQYKPGQAVELFNEAFGRQIATFKRLIEAEHLEHPMHEVEIDMMGRTVCALVDPLNVRAAE